MDNEYISETTIDNLYQQITRLEAFIDSVTNLCQKDLPYLKIGFVLGQDIFTLKQIKNKLSIVLDDLSDKKYKILNKE